MPNPRQKVRFDELAQHRSTYKTNSSLTYDQTKPFGCDTPKAPVKLVALGTVAACDAGDVPYGALERIEADGMAVVSDGIFIEFNGTVAVGKDVVAASASAIKAGAVAGDGVGKVVSQPTSATTIVRMFGK